jgi:hypothetical protein
MERTPCKTVATCHGARHSGAVSAPVTPHVVELDLDGQSACHVENRPSAIKRAPTTAARTERDVHTFGFHDLTGRL